MSRFLTFFSLSALIALAFVVVGSWVADVLVGGGVRSLLTAEGARWFVGDFTDVVCSPALVWLLLSAMAWGTAEGSGMANALSGRIRRSPRRRSDVTAAYSERMSLNIALVVAVALTAAYLFLAFAPHAALGSATGRLWGSAACRGLVPAAAFTVTAASAAYGFCSGHLRTAGALFRCMANGVGKSEPLLVAYLFVVVLLRSLSYVFCLGW